MITEQQRMLLDITHTLKTIKQALFFGDKIENHLNLLLCAIGSAKKAVELTNNKQKKLWTELIIFIIRTESCIQLIQLHINKYQDYIHKHIAYYLEWFMNLTKDYVLTPVNKG